MAIVALIGSIPLRAEANAGVPLVVTMRGTKTGVSRPLASQIRRRMVDALGPLRSSRAWRAALHTAGLSPSDELPIADITRAAQSVGADHLLDLSVYRKQESWVLMARLIRVADGRVLRRQLYPYKSMNAAGMRWHAKQIVAMTAETLASESQRQGASTAGGAASATTGTSN